MFILGKIGQENVFGCLFVVVFFLNRKKAFLCKRNIILKEDYNITL